MTQQPDWHRRHPPYPGQWRGREENTSFGYPPPHIRPANEAAKEARSPGTVYGSTRPYRRRKRGRILAAVGVVLVVGAAGAALYVWRGATPSGMANASLSIAATTSGVSSAAATASPLVLGVTAGGTDSGVAMCVQMRDAAAKSANPQAGSIGDNNTDPAAFQAMRKQFADSRYADIRDAGTRVMDVMWGWVNPTSTPTDLLAALKDTGIKFTAAYNALATACANHGVKIPAMTASGR